MTDSEIIERVCASLAENPSINVVRGGGNFTTSADLTLSPGLTRINTDLDKIDYVAISAKLFQDSVTIQVEFLGNTVKAFNPSSTDVNVNFFAHRLHSLLK